MKSVILFFLLFVTRLVSGSLSLLNSFDLGVSIEDCQPWVENDVIYIGALNGTLYAINFTTGSLIWSAQLNEPVSVDHNSLLLISNEVNRSRILQWWERGSSLSALT
jgi:outer membrane protein assembly factor BamB